MPEKNQWLVSFSITEESLKIKNVFLLFLSGSVAAYVVLNGIFLLSWICYVPFFILFKKLPAKQKLTSSIIFSFGVSAVAFFADIAVVADQQQRQVAATEPITQLQKKAPVDGHHRLLWPSFAGTPAWSRGPGY